MAAWAWVAVAFGALAAWWGLPPPPLARLRRGDGRPIERGRPGPAGRLRDLIRRRSGRAREDAVAAGVPQVCELLAVCLQAGQPARGALRVLVDVLGEPTRGVLARVLHQIDLGVPEAQAWASLGEQRAYAGVARDLARSIDSGVALAELMRHHAEDARRAAASRALVRARKAGVSSVLPLVVCFLPAFLLLGVAPIFGGLLGR